MRIQVLLGLAMAIALAGCSQPPLDVTYRVSGTARSASLTLQNETGGTEQKTVRLPWSQTMTVPAGAFLYLAAQNEGEEGSVTCEIRVGSTPIKTSTSIGAYKIASCSGPAAAP